MPDPRAQPTVIRLLDNHVERNLHVRRMKCRKIVAQSSRVERARLARAAACTSARCLGKVVGVTLHPFELQRRVTNQEIEGFRTPIEIRVDSVGVCILSDNALQICSRRVDIIFRCLAAKYRVSRNPHAAPGPGRRTAPVFGLLHEYRRESVAGCGDGCRHAGSPRSDNNDIHYGHIYYGRHGALRVLVHHWSRPFVSSSSCVCHRDPRTASSAPSTHTGSDAPRL